MIIKIFIKWESSNDMRILMVCNYYAPENTIAAVRISKLVKYFKLEGHDIDVLTEKKVDFAIDDSLISDMEGVKINYIQNSHKFSLFYEKYKKILKPHKDKRLARLDNRERINKKTGNTEFYPFETAYPIIGSLDYLVNQLRQKNLFYDARSKFDFTKHYDYIITSYGDSFCYFFGKYYKKNNKTTKWVFDIRDAVYRYKFVPKYIEWIPKMYEKYIWKNADEIVGVSQGICDRVPKKYGSKVHLITNGFDGEIDKTTSIKRISDKMTFTYTGSMYGGLQDLSKFFEAFSCLVNEQKIDVSRCEFVYAGNKSAFDIFITQARKYSLSEHCIYKGKISRLESIDLQKSSDILLMASYGYKHNNGGIITGKIFEYMASNRPVIAIVSGDIENSEVSKIIKKTNIGICYEKYNNQNDLCMLKKYILKQYNLFVANKELEYHPDRKEVSKYNYKNIANGYISILCTRR